MLPFGARLCPIPLWVIAYPGREALTRRRSRERTLMGFLAPVTGRESLVPDYGWGGCCMGLVELLLIVLVIAAIAGGIGVSPFLWLLLLVALVVLLTSGGFGYRRGGRI